MRCAYLLDRLAARGEPVDRAGSGKVIEAYPAPALVSWGLSAVGYKSRVGVARIPELLNQLEEGLGGIQMTPQQREAAGADHNHFDALVASLVARAAALGLTQPPESEEERGRAVREGWIHVPTQPAPPPAASREHPDGSSTLPVGSGRPRRRLRLPGALVLPDHDGDRRPPAAGARRRLPRPPAASRAIHSARDVAILAAVPLTVVVNLFGQAFYAGLAAAAVIEWRAHRPLPSFIPMLRALPMGRLILLDLVITLGTAIGFVLLVIPGLVFMAYFSISPALVKFEHRGVWGSMRRSRELVRGQFLAGDADRRRHDPGHRDRGVPDQRALPRPRDRHAGRPRGRRRCCSRSRGSSSWSPHWRCSSCAARCRSRRSCSAPSVTSTS